MAAGLLGEALEVFPELGMLLHQLLLGYRQLHAEQPVLQRGFVQDVVRVQCLALHLEIEAEFPRPEAVKILPGAVELAQRLARLCPIPRPDLADWVALGPMSPLC